MNDYKKNPTIKRLPKVEYEVSMVKAMAEVLNVQLSKQLHERVTNVDRDITHLATQILYRNLQRLDILTNGEPIVYDGPQVDI